jgi:hypothetical protein
MCECLFLFQCLLTIIFFILSLSIISEYDTSLQLENKTCIINNVIYPTKKENNVFINCNCGKNCISNLGTCVSVYGNFIGDDNKNNFIGDDNKNNFIGDDNKKLFKINIKSTNNYCTISETTCIKKEDDDKHNYRQNSINTAINIAKKKSSEYIKMINKTIDCYYNPYTDNIYFNNDFNMTKMIIYFNILLLLSTINAIFLIAYFKK